MSEQAFEALLQSIREGGAILRGEKPPSRKFEFLGSLSDTASRRLSEEASCPFPLRGGSAVQNGCPAVLSGDTASRRLPGSDVETIREAT